MRLFVAVDISDATRRAFRAAREALEPRVMAARVPPRLVWVGDDDAHVTVRFIGSVADARAQEIERALGRAIEHPAFALTWSTLGTFPSGRSPRVVWLGTTDDAEPIRRLAAIVNARLDPIVANGETRPLTPHLTLARVKDPGRGVEWTRALAGVRVTPSVSPVNHITLYQSHVTAKGSTYTVRMRSPLA